MADFSKEFELDDLNDPVELVLMCDRDIDEAIEKAEELSDTQDADSVMDMLKEEGIIEADADLTDEDEAMMYDEDEDDAMDIADVDAMDYRDSFDVDEAEDIEEDDVIDTVIDSDPQADTEDISDSDLR